jgi:hypothetical protein
MRVERGWGCDRASPLTAIHHIPAITPQHANALFSVVQY